MKAILVVALGSALNAFFCPGIFAQQTDGIPQFGLVAEQVEKVNPDLVLRGGEGKVMTVRYEAVNAMLLNQFLKRVSKGASEG